MDILVCRCVTCNAQLGRFLNLWVQIGKKYYSPVVDVIDGFNIVPTGAVRVGEPATVVGACQLQDIACALCDELVGSKCIKTPVNHVLHDDQLLIRRSSISMTKASDGSEAELNVQRLLQIRDSSALPGDESAGATDSPQAARADTTAPDVLRLQTELIFLKERVDRIDRGGSQIVGAFDGAVVRLENDIKKNSDKTRRIEDELADNRDDLSRVKSQLAQVTTSPDALEELRKEIRDDQDAIGLLKTELGEVKGTVKQSVKLKDVTPIQKEVKEAKKLATKAIEMYDEANNEADGLRNDLAAAKAELKKLREETIHLQKELTSARQVAKSTVDLEKEYKKEAEALAAEIDALRDEATALRNDRSRDKSVAMEAVRALKEQAGSLSELQAEMRQLKHEVAQERNKKAEQRPSAFPSKELEILTESIAKISSRASLIETLQMEFELFKSRVKRLETGGGSDGAPTLQSSRRGSDDISLIQMDDVPYNGGPRAEPSRKRPPNGRDPAPAVETPPNKRPAVEADWSAPTTAGSYDTKSGSRSGSTSSTAGTIEYSAKPTAARITLSGGVDRRTKAGKNRAKARASVTSARRPDD